MKVFQHEDNLLDIEADLAVRDAGSRIEELEQIAAFDKPEHLCDHFVVVHNAEVLGDEKVLGQVGEHFVLFIDFGDHPFPICLLFAHRFDGVLFFAVLFATGIDPPIVP